MQIAQDIADRLKSSSLEQYFLSMAPSHQKEYLQWIASAKKPETREKRIAKMLVMLDSKKSK